MVYTRPGLWANGSGLLGLGYWGLVYSGKLCLCSACHLVKKLTEAVRSGPKGTTKPPSLCTHFIPLLRSNSSKHAMNFR
jgi:hypothetical protein